MHYKSNNLSLPHHSVKKCLYTWHSNIHAISVDFFALLARGGHGLLAPLVYTPVYTRRSIRATTALNFTHFHT